jgi:histidinol-phosphate aminotransferase
MSNSSSIQIQPQAPNYVQAIAPYVGGKPIEELAREMGIAVEKIVKLASNENPLGIPASAKLAMQAAIDDLGRYPDGNAFELKTVIGQRLSIPTDWITLGNGSNDILELVARAYLNHSKSAVFSQYSFVVYGLVTQAVGARSIVVPALSSGENYLGHDLSAMLAAITVDTQIVFIANPNNPTGTFLTAQQINEFLTHVPSHVVVVLDEAYNEYLDDALRFDATQWVKQYPNLIVSRTLSKAYGLAGIRIGYAIAQPAITDILNRIRQPFNVNSLAQAAAIAAIQDDEFLLRSKAVNAVGYIQITQACERLGLSYIPSKANFILIHIGKRGGGAQAVNQALLKQGVIVRPVESYDLPDYLRISIGLEQENARFIAALEFSLNNAL